MTNHFGGANALQKYGPDILRCLAGGSSLRRRVGTPAEILVCSAMSAGGSWQGDTASPGAYGT